MPRAKRVNNSSLPKMQTKTGRHKRGIVEPVAQVVERGERVIEARMKRRTRPPRPEVEVMVELVEYLEKEFDVELV